MDWGSLVGTALGAVIGVSATLSADRLNWRRQRQDADKTAKRQTYADYLAALSRARNDLRVAARDPSTSAKERARAAIEAFSGGVYELRYQVALVAPAAVADASVAAFRTLRDLRDLVEGGVLHKDASYVQQRDAWEERFGELRDRMRLDLDSS